VDRIFGLDDLEERKFLILPGLEFRPLGRAARNQSLYRLSYPGSSVGNSTAERLRALSSEMPGILGAGGMITVGAPSKA
jgi:hypothetical protein